MMYELPILYSENIATRLFLAKTPLSSILHPYFICLTCTHQSIYILQILKKVLIPNSSTYLISLYIYSIHQFIPITPHPSPITSPLFRKTKSHLILYPILTMATTRNGTEDIHADHGVKPSIGATLLRLLQLIIALAILGMAAFVVANAAYSGAILAIFVASLTTLILLYTLLSSHRLTNIFNNWAIALLDLLLIILWLATWITAAVQIRRYRFRFGYYGCGWFFCRRDLLELEVRDELSGGGLQKRDTYWRTWRSVFIAVAVLAAVEFALFVISFFYTLARILNHRDRHHHGARAAAAGAGVGAGAGAATQKNAGDMEMQNQGQGQGHTGYTGQTGTGYTGQTGAGQTGVLFRYLRPYLGNY
ncbi:d097c1dd-7867-488a-8997-aad8414332a7 [Sclerotinia trifoliorum]|uniref:D097c1dd-7867-488a-8997-aad8414332a7 n=1 Tax=Sclerotinia trifoliorum TaxID=28548 RepID=A0A8H2ZNQ6_9HELO|nr:d097c1dd-7867-488a-8997-aad8414332a7 [Sclerotinia trifoliorum]